MFVCKRFTDWGEATVGDVFLLLDIIFKIPQTTYIFIIILKKLKYLKKEKMWTFLTLYKRKGHYCIYYNFSVISVYW